MSSRSAAFKVALKTARRNKKRTFFLVALIAAPVVVAVVVAGLVRASMVTVEEQALADFGSATVRVQIAADPRVEPWVEGVVADTDPDATILSKRGSHRTWSPGGVGRPPVYGNLTDLDLNHPISEGLLMLTEGRMPTADNEIVLSEYLASALETGVGRTVELPIVPREDNREMVVVGLASHPVFWSQGDAVVTTSVMDELDALPQGQVGWIDRVVLIGTENQAQVAEALETRWEAEKYQFFPEGYVWPIPPELDFLWPEAYMTLTQDQLDELAEIRRTQGMDAAYEALNTMMPEEGYYMELPYVGAESREWRLTWAQDNILATSPVIGTAVAAVLLVEVGFIAGAAFATGTRRRLREIGLMGSNGASDRHVRTTVVGEGVVVGLLGGLAGAIIGFVILILGRSTLQPLVTRRIEDIPVGLLDMSGPLLMALVACVVAAWYPAKTAAGVPTLTALQGRMPTSEPKRWVPVVGVVLAGFGTLLFAVGLASSGERSGAAVTVIGVLMMIGGAAMLAGPLVAWLSRLAHRFSVTPRMVLRDAGRHRTRAAAAVAATMVILVLPVVALAGGGSTIANERIYGLPPENPQMMIHGLHGDDFQGTAFAAEDRDQAAAIVAQVVGALPDSAGTEFLAITADVQYPVPWARSQAGIVDDVNFGPGEPRIAIADDALLALLNDPRLDDALARDGMVLLGVEEGATEIGINGVGVAIAEVPAGVHRWAFPRVLMTAEKAAGLGLEPTRAMGWVISEQSGLAQMNPWNNPFQEANEVLVDVTWSGHSTGAAEMGFVMAVAVLLSLLVVLVVVATITALSAAEADNELQTIVAVGAVNSVRRKYLGLQSYIHTMLGAVLAVPLALLLVKTAVGTGWTYVSVGHFGIHDSARLYVPWLAVGLLAIGLPLVVGLLTALFVKSAPLTPPRRAF